MAQTNQGLHNAYEAALRQGMDFTRASREMHAEMMNEARHGMEAFRTDAATAREDLRDAFTNLSVGLANKGDRLGEAMHDWTEV